MMSHDPTSDFFCHIVISTWSWCIFHQIWCKYFHKIWKCWYFPKF